MGLRIKGRMLIKRMNIEENGGIDLLEYIYELLKIRLKREALKKSEAKRKSRRKINRSKVVIKIYK